MPCVFCILASVLTIVDVCMCSFDCMCVCVKLPQSSLHTALYVQDLLDVNSLELARQFTIAFNSLLRDIRVSRMCI